MREAPGRPARHSGASWQAALELCKAVPSQRAPSPSPASPGSLGGLVPLPHYCAAQWKSHNASCSLGGWRQTQAESGLKFLNLSHPFCNLKHTCSHSRTFFFLNSFLEAVEIRSRGKKREREKERKERKEKSKPTTYQRLQNKTEKRESIALPRTTACGLRFRFRGVMAAAVTGLERSWSCLQQGEKIPSLLQMLFYLRLLHTLLVF